ncbi:peroxidase-like [Sitodiplosis mosellana]|uniref:peroxidase-like n=1 Tax=Sitodiplosis mosellana TaxID=263140 RepID=UPI002443CA4B|nr:peroxidase-like [Sitodiplosis mosellana]
MLAIVQILILLHTINRCWGNVGGDLYEQAKKIAAEKQSENEQLQAIYNTSVDYTRMINNERTPPTSDNLKADILLQFQYLVRDRGYCKRQTFQDCVGNYGKNIPKEDKCPARLGDCNEKSKFAPIGGYCNNLKNPNLGRANTAYIHLLKAVYSDGISKIRKAVSGEELPSPRLIGNMLSDPSFENNYSNEVLSDTNNIMGLMFGQLLTHDSSSRLAYNVKGGNVPGPRCCTLSNSGPLNPQYTNPNCIPVDIPKNDPFYSEVGVRCQSYIRMARTFDHDCKISYVQTDQVSSYLDLSIIYSESPNTLTTLRTNSSGLLRTNSKNILPQSGTIYVAGDRRVNQTPMLALLHSLFFRLHNTIAKNLASVNPKWNDNDLFFNSRRLSIAIYQSIVYNEWLPLFIGKRVCELRKLKCGGKTKIACDKYDSRIDPSTSVEFAHAAFRFFHRIIPSTFQMIDNRNQLVGHLFLSDVLLNGNATILQDKYDDLLNGMLKQTIAYVSPMHTPQIRDLTAKVPYKGHQVGTDQFLNDLMRGRDSGTAPFVDFIDYCLSKKINKWSDLRSYFKDKEYRALRNLYKDVRDIDLLVGILLETHPKNRIGQIGACIIADQYHRLRYGDRFFYSNPTNPNKFTAAQLSEIENTTFTKVLCLVTNSSSIPYQAFVTSSLTNPIYICEKTFNFGLFKA